MLVAHERPYSKKTNTDSDAYLFSRSAMNYFLFSNFISFLWNHFRLCDDIYELWIQWTSRWLRFCETSSVVRNAEIKLESNALSMFCFCVASVSAVRTSCLCVLWAHCSYCRIIWYVYCDRCPVNILSLTHMHTCFAARTACVLADTSNESAVRHISPYSCGCPHSTANTDTNSSARIERVTQFIRRSLCVSWISCAAVNITRFFSARNNVEKRCLVYFKWFEYHLGTSYWNEWTTIAVNESLQWFMIDK